MNNNIQEIREEKGMTQEELALAANISRPFLSRVETGDAVPTVFKARAIAEALGCGLDDLFPAGIQTD